MAVTVTNFPGLQQFGQQHCEPVGKMNISKFQIGLSCKEVSRKPIFKQHKKTCNTKILISLIYGQLQCTYGRHILYVFRLQVSITFIHNTP